MGLTVEILPLLVVWALSFWLVFKTGDRKHAEKVIFGAVALCFACFALKYVLLVTRLPLQYNLLGMTLVSFDPAFPSFHALEAAFVASFVLIAYWHSMNQVRLHRPKRAEFIQQTIAVALILLICTFIPIERVLSGAHTGLQVALSVIVGAIVARIAYSWPTREADYTELKRQAVHFAGVAFVFVAAFVGQYAAVALALLAAALAYTSFHNRLFGRISRPFARLHEKHHSPVAYFFVIALTLLLPPMIAYPAIIALTVGDAVTTVYGKYVGKTRWPKPFNQKKTLEASALGLIAVFAALSWLNNLGVVHGNAFVPLFSQYTGLVLFAVAAIAMLVEALEQNDRDNIAIPAAVAAYLFVVSLL